MPIPPPSERLKAVEECLLRAIAGDLSARVELSDRLDEVDAIGVGVNVLIEEQQIHVDELRTAMEQAELLASSKKALVRSVSHDFRTPLNVITGTLGLLEATRLTTDQRSLLTTVSACAKELTNLLDSIFQLSIAESSAYRPQLQESGLSGVVDGMLKVFGCIAEERQVALVATLDPALDSKHFMPTGALQQILLNLLGNALKYTNVGVVCVDLRMLGQSDDYQDVEVRVSDTGVGIPDEHLPFIFDVFYRVTRADRQDEHAAGLGLSIARQWTERMGGSIFVESTVGKGTTFRVNVRFQRLPEEQRTSSMLMPEPDHEWSVGLVEGRPGLMGALTRQLRYWGHKTHVLSVERLARQGALFPELMVLDLLEPKTFAAVSSGALKKLAGRQFLFVGPTKQAPEKLVPDGSRISIMPPPLGPSELAMHLGHVRGAVRAKAVATEGSKNPKKLSASVLLVEDNPDNQVMMRRVLSRLGCDVDIVASAEELYDIWPRGAWEIVLLDCQLPGDDGYEAAEWLRSQTNGKAIPIVGISAGVEMRESPRSVQAGMNCYLQKPITIDAVGDVLERWLKT